MTRASLQTLSVAVADRMSGAAFGTELLKGPPLWKEIGGEN